jgi:large subunit ribosomal protein L1
MAARGKKYKNAREKLGEQHTVAIGDALAKIKQVAYAKFDETVRLDVNLGINAEKTEQSVRNAVSFPHGLGKKIRVIVFAKGAPAVDAEKAGADLVGAEDLIEKIEKGWMDFEFAVATPDMMGPVGKLAKILGPRGLLPNKKVGTVTFEVGQVVKELKQGKTFFKNDRTGIVHVPIGKLSFDSTKLHENYEAFMKALVASRPAAAKGRFIKHITLSSTMGPGIDIIIDDAFKI